MSTERTIEILLDEYLRSLFECLDKQFEYAAATYLTCRVSSRPSQTLIVDIYFDSTVPEYFGITIQSDVFDVVELENLLRCSFCFERPNIYVNDKKGYSFTILYYTP